MAQRVLDVSTLPEGTADSRSLLWWGNLGMLTIEGTMFAMAIATYFYLRIVNLDWPPITVPKNDLTWPTINTVMLVLSMIAAFVADRAALRDDLATIRIGLAICVAVGITFTVIRFASFNDIGFKWSDHAYGSVIWTIAGLHQLHVFAATGEVGLLLVYSLVRPITKKQLLDIRCTCVYWYFVALTWVPLYFIVWVGPHLHRKGAF